MMQTVEWIRRDLSPLKATIQYKGDQLVPLVSRVLKFVAWGS